MNLFIIIFCFIGFIVTTLLSYAKKNLKIVNNTLLGKVSNIDVKSTIKDNKVFYSYIVTVNNIDYKINTYDDSSNVIKVGATAKLLTVASGRKFINFNDDNKSFYVFNYKDLERWFMDFNDIKEYKKTEQHKYQEKVEQQKRYIPDSSILQKPDEEFISPIDIREYK